MLTVAAGAPEHRLYSSNPWNDCDCIVSVQAATMLERLLSPVDDELNQHKQNQLIELAKINGDCLPTAPHTHVSAVAAQNSHILSPFNWLILAPVGFA